MVIEAIGAHNHQAPQAVHALRSELDMVVRTASQQGAIGVYVWRVLTHVDVHVFDVGLFSR